MNDYDIYEKMQDSGQVWLGQLPAEWSMSRIASLYSLRNEKVSDKDYPPLSVTMKGIVPQLETAAKTDDSDNRKLVRIGDFVINSRSDRRGSCGISPYDGSVSLINTVLTPREAMHPGYYDWLFHTVAFADEFYKWGHGIVDDLWTTRWQEMKRIVVPVPPLDVQATIALYLDDECSKIDSIIEEAKTSVEEYKQWKESTIFVIVTKGLEPTAPMKDSGIEWVGMIPSHWRCLPLKRVTLGRDGGAWGDEPQGDELDRICMRVADFDFDYGKFKVRESSLYTKRHYDENKIKKLALIEGDILVEKSGGGEKTPVGRAVLFDLKESALFANFMDRLSIDVETVLPSFFEYYWQAMYYCAITTIYVKQTTGIQNLNLTALLEKEAIVFPDISEQNNIVQVLDRFTKNVQELIEEKTNLINDLEIYKRALIYEAVTGKRKLV